MRHGFTRRSFLKQTALTVTATAGIPYIVGSSALGMSGAVAPSNRLQLAQLGCGSMGMGNMGAFLNLGPEVQVVAVCDVDKRHLDQAKRRVDGHYNTQDCRAYQDYREMLDNEHLDIVSHATPDHWHALTSVDCARKGIDMYGEKPLSRTIGEGRLICDAVKRYGVIWQTGSWQRSVGHFRRGAELAFNGHIGKINYVEVGLPDGREHRDKQLLPVPDYLDWDLWLGPAPWRPYQVFGGRGDCHNDWRWIMDYSGGQLTDWAGHHVDIAHWGLGLDDTGPVEVYGTGEYPADGVWDTPYGYEFFCTYAHGLQMRVANQSKLPHGMGVCWYGEKGWVHVNRGSLRASDPKILESHIGPDETRLYRSDHHQRNFIECVKTRRQTITPAETAHRSLSVGLLGEIAMLTGRRLRWNPDTERFVNDPDADRYLMRPYRSPWIL